LQDLTQGKSIKKKKVFPSKGLKNADARNFHGKMVFKTFGSKSGHLGRPQQRNDLNDQAAPNPAKKTFFRKRSLKPWLQR